VAIVLDGQSCRAVFASVGVPAMPHPRGIILCYAAIHIGGQPLTLPNPDQQTAAPDPNLESFKERRAMIIHEDQQINARLTALLFSQSFFVTTAVILLANAHQSGNSPGFYWLTICVSTISIFLGILTSYSISAARREQKYVREDRTSQYEKTFGFSGPNAEVWRKCLQSHTWLTLTAGFGIAGYYPIVSTCVWLPIIYFSALRIYRNITLAFIAVGIAAVVMLIGFGYVRMLADLVDKPTESPASN
jgi:hypothetical protein